MSTPGFHAMTAAQRRRRVALSLLRVLATCTLMLVVYGLLPAPGRSGASAVLRLVLGVVVFLGVIAWQLRSVIHADHPRVRATEALVVAFLLLVLAFAYTYLSLSHSSPDGFSEPLDKVGAAPACSGESDPASTSGSGSRSPRSRSPRTGKHNVESTAPPTRAAAVEGSMWWSAVASVVIASTSGSWVELSSASAIRFRRPS